MQEVDLADHLSRWDLAAQALAELRDGRASQVVVDAVTRSAASLVRSGRFTTPSGAREWSSHDIDDLVGDFFAKPTRVAALAERAGEGPEAVQRFRGALQKALGHVIIDRFHATPAGVLSRRVERRMRDRHDVVDVLPDHWSLDRFKGAAHWSGSDELLAEALRGLEIDPPPSWPEDSPRRPPATSTRSVDGACDTVLSAAACPVETGTVRHLVVERILPFDPAEVYEGHPGGELQPNADESPDPIAIRDAELFWESLDADERALVPRLFDSSRLLEGEGFLGLRKSAIDARQRKLRLRLLELGTSDRHGMQAARHVVDILSPAHADGHFAGGEQ